MTEQWNDIPDLEGYQASSLGKIRSIKKPKRPLVMKTYIREGKKYERILLSVDKKIKSYLVHRLVLSAFVPNPLDLTDTDHLDRNCLNNKLENLTWLSHRDNVLKDQGKTIICTHKDGRVIEIRGGRQASVELGMTRRTIMSAIKLGRTTRSGWSFKYKK
jgi:hypothetical protein